MIDCAAKWPLVTFGFAWPNTACFWLPAHKGQVTQGGLLIACSVVLDGRQRFEITFCLPPGCLGYLQSLGEKIHADLNLGHLITLFLVEQINARISVLADAQSRVEK